MVKVVNVFLRWCSRQRDGVGGHGGEVCHGSVVAVGSGAIQGHRDEGETV